MSNEIYEFEISRNAEGGILATAGLKGDDCSYRIAGPKAWGGSKRLAAIEITQRDMVEFIRSYAPGALADLAAPSVASAAPRQTDLSKRLREHAGTGQAHGTDLLLKAADEIERYYGGMLNWKASAEAKDAVQSAPKAAMTDEQISKAARYLSDFSSAQCNVDKDDAWKVYGDDEIAILRDALAAAGVSLEAK